MRRISLLVAATLIPAAAQANPPAAPPFQWFGSDSLFGVAQDVIAGCGLTGAVSYLGGGSGLGGSKMNPSVAGQGPNGDQQITPQTRFLSATECSACRNSEGVCTASGSTANRGQGMLLGLNAIGVFHDANPASACRVLRYAGCMRVEDRNAAAVLGYGNGTLGLDDGTGATSTLFLEDGPDGNGVLDHYCFRHWADALRIVYTGQHAHLDDSSQAAACSAAPPAASTITSKRCNSDVRWTLVSRWENLFDAVGDDGAGGCVSAECTQLKHALRRDDFSGITDAFLSIIGAPSLGPLAVQRSRARSRRGRQRRPLHGHRPGRSDQAQSAQRRGRGARRPYAHAHSPGHAPVRAQ